ncbi:hypothetical protein GGR50DRAFT_697495 [Xylaria sp. CBS 124048]|nr:hypothetical protein GGR50DRAFT_697495 [Xylaria sp. CBS 124048]
MAHGSAVGGSMPPLLTVPQDLKRLDMFARFPYDIRHMVWEEVIFTPGIHFLKLVETLDSPVVHALASAGVNSGGSAAALPERRAEGTQEAQRSLYSATLRPMFSFSSADNSYYITKNRTLARLRASCREANLLVKKVLTQPENVTLNSGQLVLLQRSSDVVCIDYPSMGHTRHLGRWAEHLDLDQLAKIRRLAVRYHHEWDDDLVCGYCGRVHSYHGKHPYPRHVYELAALFKNLETFYFIDYLTVRKPPSDRQPNHEPDCNRPSEGFASGEDGRTYFEVDPNSCTTHTRVYETLSWLQSSYVAHCKSKSRGPTNPENVRFKVLGCEWDSNVKLVSTRPTVSTRKKRSRNHTSDASTMTTISSQNSIVSPGGAVYKTTGSNALPVVFGDGGKSKFEFSMEVPY